MWVSLYLATWNMCFLGGCKLLTSSGDCTAIIPYMFAYAYLLSLKYFISSFLSILFFRCSDKYMLSFLILAFTSLKIS